MRKKEERKAERRAEKYFSRVCEFAYFGCLSRLTLHSLSPSPITDSRLEGIEFKKPPIHPSTLSTSLTSPHSTTPPLPFRDVLEIGAEGRLG